MVASRSARERKAAAQAGPLARVRIEVDTNDQFVYKVNCVECTIPGAKDGRPDRPWSAYRPGDDNGFMASMDRWVFHLKEKHPASDAPCLAFLGEAEQRLHERRQQQTSGRLD